MYKDDKKWITEQILKIDNYELRKKAYDGYKKVYQEYYDKEPVEHKKIGAARRNANKRLRLFITKILTGRSS